MGRVKGLRACIVSEKKRCIDQCPFVARISRGLCEAKSENVFFP